MSNAIRRRLRRPRQRGFTLVELLVVLVILGLLFGLVVPRTIGYLSRAKSDVAKMQVQNLEQALDLYRLDIGRYPTQEEGLKALVARPGNAPKWNGPYLKGGEVPADPWSRPFLYDMPSKRGLAYDLYTLGADGARGGDGENADVFNK
ncbi:MAG: type II secretion system major pseudopilin GspG [Rhodospirillales bacterium]